VDLFGEFVARTLSLAWSAAVAASAVADSVRAKFQDLLCLMPLLFACVIKTKPVLGRLGPEEPVEPAEVPASEPEPQLPMPGPVILDSPTRNPENPEFWRIPHVPHPRNKVSDA
jgi:hypothetical protein